MTNDLGIYLHFPFCVKKCGYCDFYSIPCAGSYDIYRYVFALERNMTKFSEQLEGAAADTIYFGGGTPSAVGAEALNRLLSTATALFDAHEDAEITIEANPGALCVDVFDGGGRPEKALSLLRHGGFNRISFGVQSSNDAELCAMGRLHTFEDAKRSVYTARDAGFDNISLDLMYALPNQTVEAWKTSVADIIALEPEHVSCYALRLEQGTPMYAQRDGQPDDDTQLEMYLTACGILENAGYEHYEVSNFAKPGFRSRHNSRYWTGGDYLGFGAAAHSFFRGERFFYPSDAAAYADGVMNGTLKTESEGERGDDSAAEEYIMLSLRTAEGLSCAELESRFGVTLEAQRDFLLRLEQTGLAKYENGILRLTPVGMFVSNGIIVELLTRTEKSGRT